MKKKENNRKKNKKKLLKIKRVYHIRPRTEFKNSRGDRAGTER